MIFLRLIAWALELFFVGFVDKLGQNMANWAHGLWGEEPDEEDEDEEDEDD